MSIAQHHNYVFVYDDGRVKIGRTGNPKRRLRELKPNGHALGRPVSARVALHTESHLRRKLRAMALPGSLEWFHASGSEVAMLVQFTAETQATLEAAGV